MPEALITNSNRDGVHAAINHIELYAVTVGSLMLRQDGGRNEDNKCKGTSSRRRRKA